MDEVKWYENYSLDSIKNIIKDNINTASRSFVAIGYYLKNVRDRELYLHDGYKNVLEFAEGEFNISQSWANKWMRINDRFSKGSNSPILLDEYKEFGSSVLAEMITLTDEQLGLVTLTTTRAEIRDIKKQAKKEKDLLAPAPVELESEELELDCFNYDEGWHKAQLITLSSEEPVYDEELESASNASETVYNVPGIINDEDESVIEEQKTVIEKVETELPCDTCGYDINGCCDYPDSPDDYCVVGDKQAPKEEQVETIEADIIQTVPEDEEDQEVIDPEHYTCQDIRDELNKLIEYVGMYRKNNETAPGRRKAKMRLDAIVLLDEEMRNPPVIEEPEPVQPELPVLKNNDQRKEWIDNYTSWPVWIDIPQTGERYYRYDFSNDTSFVIRVSLQHAYKGYERTKDIKYAHEEYFLLGVKDKWIPGIPTFVESSTNKSAMVEHLKEIQKKGA